MPATEIGRWLQQRQAGLPGGSRAPAGRDQVLDAELAATLQTIAQNA
jgi:hypothetical protein